MNNSQTGHQAFSDAAAGITHAFTAVFDAMRLPLSQLASQVATVLPSPPTWLVSEVQQRMVLMLNHVLQQEPEAMNRLRRHVGQRICLQWRQWTVQWVITPAGLLELDAVGATAAQTMSSADSTVQVTQNSPWDVAQAVMQGDKPEVRIEGDVQLAAQVNWLVQYVRWDVEEDISRILGDASAHLLVSTMQQMTAAIKTFVQSKRASATPSADVSITPQSSTHQGHI